MKIRNRCALLAWSGLIALATTSVVPVAAATSAAPLTLEVLYNTPSIIGTSPENYAWSADGKELAFLWDEKGRGIRDVWIYSPQTHQKRQVSFNGKDAPPSSLDGGGVSQIVWLPAGKGLLYTLGGKLFAIREGSEARQLEATHKGISQPALSPDNRKLAFIADGGTLYVRSADVEATDVHPLVPAEPKMSVQSFQWDKTSDRLALVQSDDVGLREIDIHYDANGAAHHDHLGRLFPGDETTRFRIAVVPAAGGDVKWLERPDLHDPIWNYGLSTDGHRLFVSSSDFLVKTHSIFLYDTTDGKRQIYYSNHDAEQKRADWQVTWAPQDAGLILLSDRDGHDQLYTLPKPGAEPKRLISDTYEIASFKVDPKGRMIYFVSNKSHFAERQLYRVPLAGGVPQQLTHEPGTHDLIFSPDFAYAADHFSNDMTPPDLWLVDLRRAQAAQRVTQSPTPDFSSHTWASVRYVTFPSQTDGVSLMGRIILPPGYVPGQHYPLIVGSVYTDAVRNQWGGRNAHPTWGLDQYLAARGYIQLSVSLRGSWGFGKAFKNGLTSYGGPDIEDIQSGARYMVAQGYTEPQRIGLWGSSYGGLLTLMSLFKKPGFYAVGVAGAPASNVAHAYPPQMRVMGEPKGADFPARYDAQSAYFLAGGLRDPLMIIQGTRDSTVLFSDTVALQEKFIREGKRFELVPVPGSDHKWDDNFNEETRFTYQKLADFMDRYLMTPAAH
jgi:dipeptidyl-peptidase 4